MCCHRLKKSSGPSLGIIGALPLCLKHAKWNGTAFTTLKKYRKQTIDEIAAMIRSEKQLFNR